MRYFMTFSYDGTEYKGYQKQLNQRTIQEEIEKCLKKINNNKEVDLYASGRTDAHVHALNQKAHFNLDSIIDSANIKKALNSMLPRDIYVKQVEQVDDEFHARFNVTGKEYIYKINMGEYDPIEKDYVYQYNKRLDIVEIERALKYIEGYHNFKAFTKASEEQSNYERNIVQATLIRNYKDVNKITISLVGTGFLRYMVRNIVGTLIEIGEGKRKSEDIITILESQDRKQAGKTASPVGLYLKDVFY